MVEGTMEPIGYCGGSENIILPLTEYDLMVIPVGFIYL